ncbi:Auxin-responsive protein IAA33 [Heracleum sosnowskyi]|uniref:Auxin-responsive protein n=1 Tax=Heracleum sosnowskyi TaxID=360622 RepID=A0AAD8INR1_9APIA|nr:Auxin-responsive protein IAA33 [Heracleum sosnowskyi]
MKSNSSTSYNECDRQDDREILKRRWDDERLRSIFSGVENMAGVAAPNPPVMMSLNFLKPGIRAGGGGLGLIDNKDDVMLLNSTSTTMIPPPAVTVVLEGRSICHRISLHKHASYQSLAKALRQMFVVDEDTYSNNAAAHAHDLHLSNAIPGHLIAYEDMENDLLLVGDLNWDDFVRVAKRIRILPAKTNSRKGKVVARA